MVFMMVLNLLQASHIPESNFSWPNRRLALDQGLPIQATEVTLTRPYCLGTQGHFGSIGMVARVQSG